MSHAALAGKMLHMLMHSVHSAANVAESFTFLNDSGSKSISDADCSRSCLQFGRNSSN